MERVGACEESEFGVIVFEGRMRRAACKNGVVMDELIYSVIREDWKNQQSQHEEEGEAKIRFDSDAT